jgi:hypothetical protein
MAMDSNQTNKIMTSKIHFYEGSILYETIITEIKVTPIFIKNKLAKKFKKNPTNLDLWAILLIDEIEIARFIFYDKKLFSNAII